MLINISTLHMSMVWVGAWEDVLKKLKAAIINSLILKINYM